MKKNLKEIGKEALAEAKVRQKNKQNEKKAKEINGPEGLEPTRYGDWEKKELFTIFSYLFNLLSTKL